MNQQNKQATHQKDCTRKNRGLCDCDPSSKSPAWELTPDEETALSPKHTPTPWIFDNDDIMSVSDGLVATMTDDDNVPLNENWKENAAFIVRAVNSHDRLVNILERILEDGQYDADRLELELKYAKGDL